MKPLDSDKKVSKEVSAPAEATQTAPVVEEKIDFSNVQIEPLFEEMVDFDTFSKSDFRAVKVKECVAVPKSKKIIINNHIVCTNFRVLYQFCTNLSGISVELCEDM